jgi:non-specific serine/threonine protein kinase
MAMTLCISPHGRLFIEAAPENERTFKETLPRRIIEAFSESPSVGILHLSTTELQTSLPADFSFVRDFGRTYLTQLCHTPEIAGQTEFPAVPPPTEGELAVMVLSAPPMRGLEYLSADVLSGWWTELDALVRKEVHGSGRAVQEYLRERNPLWRTVGRVSFHLAENKRDADYPFAFMATYSSRLSALGRAQHLPLGRALQEYAGAKNRSALLSLLQPIHRAAERVAWVKEMVDAGDIYSPLAWTPKDAYRLLKNIPMLEESGLIVRVPDWWKTSRPPRPVVSVTVGNQAKVSADALLDFSVSVTFDGQPLDDKELRALLESSGGLVALRGKWVELDRDKLAETLKHWKSLERVAQHGGISFFEGMRMLSGASLEGDTVSEIPEGAKEWVGITAGEQLADILKELRHPEQGVDVAPPNLRTELRPYQRIGVHWLRFMTRLGLGACLADDMGLGKTVQIIALLLHQQAGRTGTENPSLLIVPASLIGNWKAELSRFAPCLSVLVAHPSEMSNEGNARDICAKRDLVITTYAQLGRLDFLRQREWKLVILDEAQAIKNSGTRQARAVKELRTNCRIALTGTPVENRLSDLWSLFDFLNPGLLGGAKTFASFVKQRNARGDNAYGPLRMLVQPYILRRLKTDKQVISDLPEKTEVIAFCGLSKQQAALYQQSVRELAEQIERVDGIQRRGTVLSYLMRLKQICNHPSQLTGDNAYTPEGSGKFQRLAEICQELAERQEKVLIFSQFREIVGPLAEFLRGVFGRPGLVMHGQTSVGKRRELVEAFQRDDGPPFFVLSLKAGGTGLNLTSASYVIHFDRWWNPSVENQATDRAFRIGQKRNVFVHKFVCRGTVEDKIDELIEQKEHLSRELLDGGGEALLTEMSNDQLLRFVALDINKAMES